MGHDNRSGYDSPDWQITPLFPPAKFMLEREARNLIEQLEQHARKESPELSPAQSRRKVVEVLRAELERLEANVCP